MSIEFRLNRRLKEFDMNQPSRVRLGWGSGRNARKFQATIGYLRKWPLDVNDLVLCDI